MSGFDFPAEYLAKAERALSSARVLLEDGDAEGSCNRAYYAMFNAAHSALFKAGFGEQTAAIKTHAGLLSFFGKQLVGTERIAGEYGRAINKAGRLRTSADYLLRSTTESEARWAVEGAEAFLAAVRALPGD